MNRDRSTLTSLLILIAVPAVVSVVVTWLVLTIWGRQQEPDYVMLPTFSGTALIPPATRSSQTDLPDNGGDQTGEPTEEFPDPGPGCENPVHIVASGETLGFIAEQYDVSLEDITAMNEMVDPDFNPNFLSIGQEIVVPVCGIPTPTPTVSPTPTTRVVPTPRPTATDLPADMMLVEIARVLDPGDITQEAVEIINRGAAVARMGGWTLVNESGDSFEFPPLNLFPQGAITVYTGAGENTATEIFWGRDSTAWRIGQIARLFNADGDLVFEYEIVRE